jgi:hypothetical protein
MYVNLFLKIIFLAPSVRLLRDWPEDVGENTPNVLA